MKPPRPRRVHVRCVFCGAALEKVEGKGAWGICLLCFPGILEGNDGRQNQPLAG